MISYLSTPIKVGYSPAQLLMSGSVLPISKEELRLKLLDTYYHVQYDG